MAGQYCTEIVDHFSGVSPLFAKEAVHRAGLANKVTLPKALLALFAEVKEHRFIPNITTVNGKDPLDESAPADKNIPFRLQS